MEMETEMEDLRIKLDDGDLVVRCHGEVLCQLTVVGGVKPIWRGGEVDDAPQIPASITVVCKIGLGLLYVQARKSSTPKTPTTSPKTSNRHGTLPTNPLRDG